MDLLKELQGMDPQERKQSFLSSGNLALDMTLSGRCDGNGGYEFGKVAEIYGPAQSGKSYLILKAVANFQEQCKAEGIQSYFIFYDDIDNGVDPTFARKIGVDPEDRNLLVTSLRPQATHVVTAKAFEALAQYSKTIKVERAAFIKNGFGSSPTIEAAFQRIWGFSYLIQMPALYIIDPLSKLSCEFEIQSALQREDQGKRAKAVQQAMRVLPGRIAESGSLLIISNHPYTGPGNDYDPGWFKKTSAGTGLVTTASLRVELRNVLPIRESKTGPVIGVNVRPTTIKNRGAHPFQESEMELFWDNVVPKYSGLLQKLVDLGYAAHTGGGRYTLRGLDGKFYKKDFKEICEKNPTILKDISDDWEVKA